MQLMEYRNKVLEDIRINAGIEMTSEKEEFLNYFTNTLIDSEELNEFIYLPFEEIGKKNRRIQIDGYSYDELDNCLCIISCLFENSADPQSLTASEADKIFTRAKNFIEESISGSIKALAEPNSPANGFATDLIYLYKNVVKYKFYIITDSIKSFAIKEIKSDIVASKPAEYNIWDIDRLHKLYESRSGKEDIVIDLREFTERGIPCLPASETDDYTSYLCNVPGKILADLYNTYGGRLLEGNVRSFLTTRGKVNKGIRNTILNDAPMFFAFNNGIAATAYEIKLEIVDYKPYITEITALQIVNGGQTTASLAMALVADKDRANNLQNVYVPMKLSVVSPEKAESLIPKISRYANSQNKVSDADFFSNHQFHIRMEEFSRKIFTPAINGSQYGTKWYYERANGQYRQDQAKLSAAEKTKFMLLNPKTQMITKTEFAKYTNLYRMFPHIVSMGSQKNFLKFAEWVDSQWEKNSLDFHNGFFRNIVSVAILFKSTDKIVKKQPWYESGYKANIVAYTISKLFHLIETRHPGKSINLKTIWNNQDITYSMEKQIVYLSEQMYLHLTDEKRDLQNVTEWAKRENCWKRAIEINVKLNDDFVSELIDKSKVIDEQKEQRKDQGFLNKVNAMVEVANYGTEKWQELKTWNKTYNVLNFMELELLNAAIQMERGKFPTEKQCIDIMKVLERARVESYPQ